MKNARGVAGWVCVVLVVIAAPYAAVAAESGSIIGWGGVVVGVDLSRGFEAVAAGWNCSLGLKADGSIVAWGYNEFGLCNVPSPNTGFVAIAAGRSHNLGLKADGMIVAWGYNAYGQCNVPSPNTGFVAIAAGANWGGEVAHSLGLKADGSIVAWGYNNSGQCDVPAPNAGFVAVAAGGYHSLGLRADGSIATWGNNRYGQCDVPEPNTGFVTVAAGYLHSLGLKADGSIVAWGENAAGQCNVPLPNAGFVAAAVGVGHSLGLRTDGSIVAWGDNADGQCNLPLPNAGFVAVAADGWHSLGLRTDGSIVAWGYNACGQCNVPEPNAGFVAVAGYFHSLGLKADGSVVAWGYNGDGRCNVPAPNTGFAAVAAGGYHSLGLKADGSVVAWGSSDPDYDYGQCDVPEPNTGYVAVAAGSYHSLGLKADGSVVAWGNNSEGQCNVPAPNTGFAAVAAGWDHSLGLRADGSVVAWGNNENGQCSVPAPNTGFEAVAAGGGHSLGLKADGSVVAWGYNYYGQCNVPAPNAGFVAVAAGGGHSLGVKGDVRRPIPIALGERVAGTARPYGFTDYRLDLEAGDAQHLLVRVYPSSADGSWCVWGNYGSLPMFLQSDWSGEATSDPGVIEMLIPSPAAGEYFFSIYPYFGVGGASVPFEIEVLPVERHLSRITLARGGNTGTTTVQVRGLGFEPGMRLELRDGGNTLLIAEPTDTLTDTLTVRLDLSGVTPGVYDVVLVWPSSAEATLPAAFEVIPGIGPRLEARIVAPPQVRPGRTYTVSLEYANTGDADMISPLFVVSCPGVQFRLATDAGWRQDTIQVLGVNPKGPAGVLPPGAANSIPIEFLVPAGASSLNFELRMMEQNQTPIDWEQQAAVMRPADMDEAEWAAVWPQIRAWFGETWAGYLDMLRNEAERLRQAGSPYAGVNDLTAVAVRRALSEPVAIICGRVFNAETGAPLAGGIIKAQTDDDSVSVPATMGMDGHFVILNVPDGTYSLYVEGHYFDPPERVTISNQADVTGLVLRAQPVPTPEPAPPSAATPDRYPVLCSDNSGAVFMIWARGGESYWAKWASGAWTQSGKAFDGGVSPVLGFSASLLDSETTPGLYAVWEQPAPDTGNGIVMAAVGRITADGVIWSEPAPVSGTAYDNEASAVAFLASGRPLVVWLQHDASIVDDTDLYYALPIITQPAPKGGALNTEMPGSGQSSKAEVCTEFRLNEWWSLPDIKVPVIGRMPLHWEIFGKGCGEENCVERVLSGKVTGKVSVDLSHIFSLEASAGGALSAAWGLECEPMPDYWFFKRGELDVTAISARGEWLAPIPLVLPTVPPLHLGTLKLGGYLEISGGGQLRWVSKFPDWPDDGAVTMSVEGGGMGKIQFADVFGLADEGLVGGKGTLGLKVNFEWNPPQPFKVEGCCVILTAEAQVLYGLVHHSWSWKQGNDCGKQFEAGPKSAAGTYVAASQKSLQKIWILDDESPGEVVDESIIAPLVGTGNVYEGSPVFPSVTSDVYGDGGAALALGDDGKVLMLWSKDTGDYETAVGSRIAASNYDGSQWSGIAYVDATAAFNGRPAVAFVSGDKALAVWSQASSQGLNQHSDIQALLDAPNSADMVFSVCEEATWSTPAPIAATEGRDCSPCLSVAAPGDAVVVWQNINENQVRILASAWNGSGWSDPEEMVSTVACDAPSIAATPDGYLIAWAQDIDGDPATPYDWAVRYVTGRPGAWSLPATLSGGQAKSDRLGVVQAQTSGSRVLRGPAKDANECCPDKPKPPDPPVGPPIDDGTSNVVQPIDPNEKVGPRGIGSPETERFVQPGDELSYVVYFENVCAATAPAQEVYVTDYLDADLDWSTFRITEITWGAGNTISIPAGTAAFYTRVTVPDHRVDVDKQWWVDVSVDINYATGRVQWLFRTLDPDTGELPADVNAGFLPPNKIAGECAPEDQQGPGEAHVAFTVTSKPGLSPETRIANNASIVFDLESPIVTNEVFNTIGSATADVPAVLGMTEADAQAAILAAGLTVGTVAEEYSATVAAGVVSGQDPASGSQVLPGSAVSLVVSKGPQPVAVPNVVGMTRAAAETAIMAAGLTVGTVTEEYSATVAAGVVSGQDPASGSQVLPGSAVSLVVSKGPQPVAAPNVVGMTQAAAETAIMAAGLAVGAVTEEYSNTVPAGNVISQNPNAGANVNLGTPVSLMLSRGAEEPPAGCSGGTLNRSTGGRSIPRAPGDTIALGAIMAALVLGGRMKKTAISGKLAEN